MSSQKDHQDLSLLLSAGATQPALAAHLDALDGAQRIKEVRSLSGRAMAALFQRCEGAPAYTLADLVPPGTPVGQTVTFAGKNSLPLFSLFEKRFTRTAGGKLIGFNFQQMSAFTGPGYFTLAQAQAEVLFDYTKVPDQSEAPADWPPVRGNEAGISYFVFRNLHDFCRRVSQDVIIGRASRLGRPMNQYFILARAG